MLPLDSAWLPWIEGMVINTGLLALAWLAPKKLLTPAGYGHAWALGVLLWGCLGWPGYALMMIYFLVGSAVTKVGMARKQAAGIAEGRSGMRGPENVWGSALAGTLCALAIWGLNTWAGPSPGVWIAALGLGYVASLSTKLSDTTASEVGKAYGRRTFLMTTLKPVPAGTEGAVSLEGTLAGVLGSAVMAIAGWGVGLIALWGIPICLVAALIATSAESVIGATVQGQWPWLTNEVVNIINTTLGALVAMGLGLVWVGLG
ncbi:TIGR00297 family protein [Nodosilinea sp. P-1105]|uniref:TIGR00297 family protein n=1 Tax=Nodosilinea sp. P-1105 TaxID=2546229 RepID=UPI00146C617D|nr:TIGR00297 family protein [Nodosilinea sp. P-1105]NMF82123.1 TIGR00297 family protein [Nodosilinea sp. P-1105]